MRSVRLVCNAGMTAAILCTAAAMAQNAPPQQGSAGGDVGFFRPAPDPALTQWPAPSNAIPSAAVPADEAAEIAKAELAASEREWAERQMDRAESENARAREEASRVPSVGAAFTGSTSERDR